MGRALTLVVKSARNPHTYTHNNQNGRRCHGGIATSLAHLSLEMGGSKAEKFCGGDQYYCTSWPERTCRHPTSGSPRTHWLCDSAVQCIAAFSLERLRIVALKFDESWAVRPLSPVTYLMLAAGCFRSRCHASGFHRGQLKTWQGAAVSVPDASSPAVSPGSGDFPLSQGIFRLPVFNSFRRHVDRCPRKISGSRPFSKLQRPLSPSL